MAGYWDEVTTDAPTLFLKTDEASGNLTDSSGGSHTATVTGSPTYQVAGPATGVPYGITIESGSYFTVADHADLDLGDGPFSIEFWFKRGTDSDSGTILAKADASTTPGYIVQQASTDFLRLEDGSTSSHLYPNSATYLNNTNWHHVVFTRPSAATGKLYIDASDVTDSTAKTFSDNNLDLLIGRRTVADSSYAGVTLAGIAIYKSELSAGRVSAHYTAKDTLSGGGGGGTVRQRMLMGIG